MAKDGVPTRGRRFVEAILARAANEPGFGAALRRADNPATEYQSWEHLIQYGCDIEKKWERLPFATVAAAASRARVAKDGHLSLGQSVAASFEDGNRADPARAKLRRLIACTEMEEVCEILRPVLSFIASRGVPISYGLLLDDLLAFGDRVRLRWASQFYQREGERT